MQLGRVCVVVLAAMMALSACGEDNQSTSSNGGSGGSSGGASGSGGKSGSSGMSGMGNMAGMSGTAGSSNTGGTGGAIVDANLDGPVACSLGTMYPNSAVIDPDAPVFQDSKWTQQQVTDAFAQAKTDNSKAYLGYKAAHLYSQYLDCAFCACGCATSIGHLSAIDCFKDMHGFT